MSPCPFGLTCSSVHDPFRIITKMNAETLIASDFINAYKFGLNLN